VKSYVALLRGINVGGRNSLPMSELIELFSALGYVNVQTYIQSGNVVFESPKKVGQKEAESISQEIFETRGFTPHILILGENDLLGAVEKNPFPTADGNALHLFFMGSKPKQPNIERLAGLKAESEQFVLAERVFYLLAPNGIGRSKLAPAVESALGVPATARNWNTVNKLASMIKKA
jgi:uncharacterized protein (DUF1697 family)